MKIVGIIRGGVGENYLPSLKEGGDIISFLHEHMADEYKPVDILIDSAGVWHLAGVPIEPANLMHRIDVAWNTTHPSYSSTLRDLSIPHITEPAHFHKYKKSRDMLREHMKKIGIHLPKHILIPMYQPDIDGPVVDFAYRKAHEVFQKFGAPWVVRSYPPNIDMGVHVAKTFDALVRGILDATLHYSSIEVEELVSEKDFEVHTVSGFRGEDVYALPIEGIKREDKEKIAKLAIDMHKHFEAEHYFNARLAMHPKRGIFLYEVRLLPSLHKESNLHKAGELIGLKTKHIMSHILGRAK